MVPVEDQVEVEIRPNIKETKLPETIKTQAQAIKKIN